MNKTVFKAVYGFFHATGGRSEPGWFRMLLWAPRNPVDACFLLAISLALLALTGCAGFSARIVRTLNCDQVHAMVKYQGFGPTVQLDEEDRVEICAMKAPAPVLATTPPGVPALAASRPVSVNSGGTLK